MTATRPAIPAQHFATTLALFAVILSLASFVLVMQGATDEPYVVFRAADALSQVGLGSALIAFWTLFVGGVCYGVCTRRLSIFWLFSLLWVAIVLFYLRFCPFGYIEDITRSIRRG